MNTEERWNQKLQEVKRRMDAYHSMPAPIKTAWQALALEMLHHGAEQSRINMIRESLIEEFGRPDE